MGKPKSPTAVARRLGLSFRGAKALVAEVRDSLHEPQLAIDEIIRAIDAYPEIARTADSIVTVIKAKRGIQKRPIFPKRTPRSSASLIAESSLVASHKPTPRRRTALDEARTPIEDLHHCPHGVPLGQVCAICDPEGFHRMTGL